MRLSNREKEVIIDEIFEKISQPIIDENNRVLEGVDIDKLALKDEYLQDLKKYELLQKEIDILEEKKRILNNKYPSHTIYNGYDFNYERGFGHSERYIDYIKNKVCILKKYPSKREIEKEIILSGNKDISEIVKSIIKKFEEQYG